MLIREGGKGQRWGLLVFSIYTAENSKNISIQWWYQLYQYHQCRFVKDVACNDCISHEMGLSALNVIAKLKLILIVLTEEPQLFSTFSPSPVCGVYGVPVYDVVCMFVNQSTECQTIPPAGGHVSDLHRVVLHLPPAPLLQGLHSHHVLSVETVVVVVVAVVVWDHSLLPLHLTGPQSGRHWTEARPPWPGDTIITLTNPSLSAPGFAPII